MPENLNEQEKIIQKTAQLEAEKTAKAVAKQTATDLANEPGSPKLKGAKIDIAATKAYNTAYDTAVDATLKEYQKNKVAITSNADNIKANKPETFNRPLFNVKNGQEVTGKSKDVKVANLGKTEAAVQQHDKKMDMKAAKKDTRRVGEAIHNKADKEAKKTYAKHSSKWRHPFSGEAERAAIAAGKAKETYNKTKQELNDKAGIPNEGQDKEQGQGKGQNQDKEQGQGMGKGTKGALIGVAVLVGLALGGPFGALLMGLIAFIGTKVADKVSSQGQALNAPPSPMQKQMDGMQQQIEQLRGQNQNLSSQLETAKSGKGQNPPATPAPAASTTTDKDAAKGAAAVDPDKAAAAVSTTSAAVAPAASTTTPPPPAPPPPSTTGKGAAAVSTASATQQQTTTPAPAAAPEKGAPTPPAPAASTTTKAPAVSDDMKKAVAGLKEVKFDKYAKSSTSDLGSTTPRTAADTAVTSAKGSKSL